MLSSWELKKSDGCIFMVLQETTFSSLNPYSTFMIFSFSVFAKIFPIGRDSHTMFSDLMLENSGVLTRKNFMPIIQFCKKAECNIYPCLCAHTHIHISYIHTYLNTQYIHTYKDLENGLSNSVYMEHCQITNYYFYCTFFCIRNLECGIWYLHCLPLTYTSSVKTIFMFHNL